MIHDLLVLPGLYTAAFLHIIAAIANFIGG